MVCLADRRVLTSAHDAAGNMTLAARPGDEADAGDGLVLVYDAWNRLVEAYDDDDADGEADAGELIVTTAYDGLGRRIAKTVEGTPDVTTDTYYNTAWQVLETRRSDYTNDPYEQYVWDARYIDAPVLRDRDSNDNGTLDETVYYTTDANMNVTALVNTSGNVVERYAYDPYGQVIVLNGANGTDPDVDGSTVFEWDIDADGASDVANVILYCGYHLDPETGLYLVRRRVYHPTLARWLQRDPIGYADGMGLYEYVSSSPSSRLDPAGLADVYEGIYAYSQMRRDTPHSDRMRNRSQAVVDSLRQSKRHYASSFGLPNLADRLEQGLGHALRITDKRPPGGTGGWRALTRELMLPSNANKETITEELIHAYDSAAGITFWGESAEALAATWYHIHGNLSFLDRVEHFISARGPCSRVKAQWANFWEGLRADFGGTEDADRARKVHWQTHLPFVSIDRSRPLTYTDAEKWTESLGLNISCEALARKYNRIMCDEKIPDGTGSGECCKVTCPRGLPRCFIGDGHQPVL